MGIPSALHPGRRGRTGACDAHSLCGGSRVLQPWPGGDLVPRHKDGKAEPQSGATTELTVRATPAPYTGARLRRLRRTVHRAGLEGEDDITPRIMFVTDHIHFPQGGGGGERNTHDLCLELTLQKHAVAVAVGLTADGSMLAWSSRIRRMLPPRTAYVRDGACGYPTFRGWGLDGLPQAVDRFRPDVVVVQSTRPNGIFDALASRATRKVLYVHEVEDLEVLRKIYGGFRRFANPSSTNACH
jgi:hypothetical protein